MGDRAAEFVVTTPEEFVSLAALKDCARGAHDEIDRYLAAAAAARLEERILMPWFSDPPLSITVTEALTQCAIRRPVFSGPVSVADPGSRS